MILHKSAKIFDCVIAHDHGLLSFGASFFSHAPVDPHYEFTSSSTRTMSRIPPFLQRPISSKGCSDHALNQCIE